MDADPELDPDDLEWCNFGNFSSLGSRDDEHVAIDMIEGYIERGW